MEIKFTPRARAEHSPPFLVVMANASTVRKKKKKKKEKEKKKGKGSRASRNGGRQSGGKLIPTEVRLDH
jgi:hypothetical protein